MKRTLRYFVDMDGTLARFFDDVEWRKNMFRKGFFANLKPYEKLVKDIRKMVKCGRDVYILTKCVNTPYCAEEKIAWIQKYIPELKTEKILCQTDGQTKANYIKGLGLADGVAVLIDDYGVNLTAWENELKNGIAIKVINDINGKTDKKYMHYIYNV